MVKKNKDSDYEPIKNKNEDKLKELNEYINNDAPPDDLQSVIIQIFKKFNIITSLFIFMLYILVSTDCFQLHIVRELYNSAYDSKTDSITDSGIVFNGVLISLSYLLFDVFYNK